MRDKPGPLISLDNTIISNVGNASGLVKMAKCNHDVDTSGENGILVFVDEHICF